MEASTVKESGLISNLLADEVEKVKAEKYLPVINEAYSKFIAEIFCDSSLSCGLQRMWTRKTSLILKPSFRTKGAKAV